MLGSYFISTVRESMQKPLKEGRGYFGSWFEGIRSLIAGKTWQRELKAAGYRHAPLHPSHSWERSNKKIVLRVPTMGCCVQTYPDVSAR